MKITTGVPVQGNDMSAC